jgi:acetyl-CoA acyltransferase 2
MSAAVISKVASSNSVLVVGAKRTPFGAFGGSLQKLTATQLGAVATSAALKQANVLPDLIKDCYFGNVIQSSNDAAYLARHVALQVGAPQSTPALTINRLCGSGFETVVLGAKSIQLGQSSGGIVVAGGSENMSQAPLQVNGIKARFGIGLGTGMQLGDALWDGLTDAHAQIPMGMTAENLARQYGISREECDQYALLSQSRWKDAHDAGFFQQETAAVEVQTKKNHIKTIEFDEHPRPESTLDKISKLPPVFVKDGSGVVTAANASGICDGAGAILLADSTTVQDHNLTPLCRIAAYSVVGCDPKVMGIGPVPAIQNLLRVSGIASLVEIDRVEINEAFAAQFLACAKALDLDMTKTNKHGGAIALGHPLAASGSRITAHLAHEFARDPALNLAIGAACIGGGQGIAILLERV